MKFFFRLRSILVIFFSIVGGFIMAAPQVSIVSSMNMSDMAKHGLQELTEALRAKKISFEIVDSFEKTQAPLVVIIGLSTGEGLTSQLMKTNHYKISSEAESLAIFSTNWENKKLIVVAGYDEKGIMYALLDMSTRISWTKNTEPPFKYVKNVSLRPYVKERGLSMYTMNKSYWESRFYDENFWNKYFDMMAQNRFNMLEILFGYENGGFMAPCYSYFFDVEGFPGVKMSGITAAQQQRNLATMNHIIQMAHSRGIAIRLGIWDHIYRGAVQAGGNPDFNYVPNQPQWWQTGGLDSANIRPYTKAAFAKFVKLIPDLDAILFKTNNESGLKESELLDFSLNFFQTVKENAPDMMIDIHAKGLTDTLIRSAINMGIKFRILPKFWMEQMGLPFSPTHINREDQHNRRHGYADMLRYPQQYQMLWKLWNGGTNRVFLWGDPDYAKRFVESSHFYNSSAYEVYEPLATKMESQAHDAQPFALLNPPYQYYTYEFERYWYFFQTFGLTGYDTSLLNEISAREFENRFGSTTGLILRSAINEASHVLPRIVAACYPYSFFPTTSAWPEKQRLGDLPLYAKAEGSDLQQFASFDEEAQVLLGKLETAKTLPSTTSFWLSQLSKNILSKCAEAAKSNKDKTNKEYISTITDLRMLANLALYHSRRIPAAVSYCLFIRTKDVRALDQAILHEQNALKAWQQIVKAAGDVYAGNILIGRKPLSGHWKDEELMLVKGIEKLKEQRSGLTTASPALNTPLYKQAADASNSRYFTINAKPVTSAAAGDAITVKIKLRAVAGLKWVRLQYRAVNQYKDFETIMMTATNVQNEYEAIIPASSIDTRYNLMYLVEMMDKNGKGFIYPDLNIETPYVVTEFVR